MLFLKEFVETNGAKLWQLWKKITVYGLIWTNMSYVTICWTKLSNFNKIDVRETNSKNGMFLQAASDN